MTAATLFKPADLAERMQLARDWAKIAQAERTASDALNPRFDACEIEADEEFHHELHQRFASEMEAVDALIALLTAPEMQAEIHALKGGA
ncbi:hypothetical protein [Tabrizicola fusiformis]|uniref:hypothetical protein n=1 Tax=Tabrizicola sp. SY72 TaxID=2741673 RepID=UPI0015736B65|nr:hypothetical protein [Tabrizicola sp. SY72]NTT86894.1 hypothetical protein [Tabrizicola sp. SY72]